MIENEKSWNFNDGMSIFIYGTGIVVFAWSVLDSYRRVIAWIFLGL
jgi:hypothetical protein